MEVMKQNDNNNNAIGLWEGLENDRSSRCGWNDTCMVGS